MKELLIYQDEDGMWAITSEKIPGFVAKGRTREEALDKMKQAFTVYYPCGDECKDS